MSPYEVDIKEIIKMVVHQSPIGETFVKEII